MKVLLIGNCKTVLLEKLLAPYIQANTFWYNNHTPDERQALFDSIHKANYDAIISQPFCFPECGKLQSTHMREHFKGKFFTITNIFYRRFQPDFSEYEENNEKYASFVMGAWHSKCILNAYKNKKGINEAIDDFLTQTYDVDALKIQDEAFLLRHEKAVDIPFAKQFLEYSQDHQSMLTATHPTKHVMAMQAKSILDFLGVKCADDWGGHIPDLLELHEVPPAYGDTHIAFRYSFDEKLNPRKNISDYSLECSLEFFVKRSFLAYKKQGLPFGPPFYPYVIDRYIQDMDIGLERTYGL